MSNPTSAVWPHERQVPATHTVHPVVPFAMDLIVDDAVFDGSACEIEELAHRLRDLVHESGLLKREPQIAGLLAAVEALRVADNTDALVDVLMMFGWLSNFAEHTSDDLAAALLALLPLASTPDVIDARSVAEHAIRKSADEQVAQ